MEFTDHDELARRLKRRKRRQRSDIFWNFLTVCTVLATIVLIGVLLMVFSNPYLSLNPFPPPTMPALAVYPTATPTLVTMPSTWTPTPLLATNTPEPTASATSTPEPSETPGATATTGASNTDDQVYSFAIQNAPSAVKSTVFKPETGCTWQGVAGQVMDMQNQALVNYSIVLKGTYDGKTVSSQTISGTHTEFGDSGYMFQLGTTPIASSGLLSIQMVDQGGLPLSAPVIFDTFSTCDKNLVLINFKQIK